MRSDYTAEPTVVFLKTHGSGYATMQRTNAPRNISPSSNFSFKKNCTLDEKKERKINRPNVSEGCVTHCPSVNSQLIRCAVARHQKVSRRRQGWPAGVKCSSHDHMFHSALGGGVGWGGWKADLCKHKANKQTNPRGRGNPPRPGPIPLSDTSEMQSVDIEFGSMWSQNKKKTLILASFFS